VTPLFVVGNFLFAAALFYNYATKGHLIDYVLGTVGLVTGALIWAGAV
jgi:hypothetical protein